MRKLIVSNTIFISIFVVVFTVYPVFGEVLHNISGGIDQKFIDRSSIIEEYFDADNSDFISADIPLESVHDWDNREEIITYEIQEQDTLEQLSIDFRISAETISNINALTSSVLVAGNKLIIPPREGFVYTSLEGDTLENVARKYNITPTELSKNNPFISNFLRTGTLVYLPGVKVLIEKLPKLNSQFGSTNFGNRDILELPLLSPDGKGFVKGHCTYFVAQHWDVQWRGHAKDWYINADKAGYLTGQIAKTGAIAVWYGPGYNLSYGHVGIVLSVNESAGTMVVQDMNYTGLWRITTRTEKTQNRYLRGFIYNQKK